MVVCFYRIPNSGNEGLITLNTWLEERQDKKSGIIMCGDMNVDVLRNTKLSKELKTVLKSHGIKNTIRGITRRVSKTSIDHVYMNSNLNKDSITEIMDEELADHFSISIKLRLIGKITQNRQIQYNLETDETIREFRAGLNLTNWDEVTLTDTDTGTMKLIDIINQISKNKNFLTIFSFSRK